MSKDNSLAGNVAIVTGASSGMGQAIAFRFARAGCSIVAHGRHSDRLKQTVRQVESEGAHCLPVRGDVRQYGLIRELIQKAIEAFGQVDILVNNAGYGLCKTVGESSEEELTEQIEANLNSVVYGCRAVLPHMRERKQGLIINMGSIASTRHFPHFAAYTAAKWGVMGFSRSLYEEVRKDGIRVSVVCPAAVNTSFIDVAGLDGLLPYSRSEMLQPEDIAETVYHIAVLPKHMVIEDLVVWPICQAT